MFLSCLCAGGASKRTFGGGTKYSVKRPKSAIAEYGNMKSNWPRLLYISPILCKLYPNKSSFFVLNLCPFLMIEPNDNAPCVGIRKKRGRRIKCNFIKHFCFHWHYQYRNKIPLKQENTPRLYQLETFTTLKLCMFKHRTWCQEKKYIVSYNHFCFI